MSAPYQHLGKQTLFGLGPGQVSAYRSSRSRLRLRIVGAGHVVLHPDGIDVSIRAGREAFRREALKIASTAADSVRTAYVSKGSTGTCGLIVGSTSVEAVVERVGCSGLGVISIGGVGITGDLPLDAVRVGIVLTIC